MATLLSADHEVFPKVQTCGEELLATCSSRGSSTPLRSTFFSLAGALKVVLADLAVTSHPGSKTGV